MGKELQVCGSSGRSASSRSRGNNSKIARLIGQTKIELLLLDSIQLKPAALFTSLMKFAAASVLCKHLSPYVEVRTQTGLWKGNTNHQSMK
jgi:hypothetical protein